MKGWIIYKKSATELSVEDHGVNRLREEASREGFELEVYKPEQLDLLSSNEEANVVLVDKKRVSLPDVVIPRTGAESSYLALASLRHLECQGVPLCNSSASILNVKDKMLMNQKIKRAGLPSPKTLFAKFPLAFDWIADEIGFPLVIKALSGARGQGIFLCETMVQLRDMADLLSLYRDGQGFILQSFVQESYGCDLRVFVLKDRILGCMKRISNGGFKANFSLGGRVEDFPVTDEITTLALSVTRLFDLEIAGVDLLFTKDGFTVCEANSSPGFKGMEKASQKNIASAMIAYALSKGQKK